jgi:hypothetical protein
VIRLETSDVIVIHPRRGFIIALHCSASLQLLIIEIQPLAEPSSSPIRRHLEGIGKASRRKTSEASLWTISHRKGMGH